MTAKELSEICKQYVDFEILFLFIDNCKKNFLI